MRTSNESTEGHEAQTGGELYSRTAYLRSLLLSCISSSGAEEETFTTKPGEDRNHNPTRDSNVNDSAKVKSQSDVGKAPRDRTVLNSKHSTNPLKKYAPVSVPGWEVNVIYKPSIYKPPKYKEGTKAREGQYAMHETRDVASLLDNLEGLREEAVEVYGATVQKSLIWNPVYAVQKLIKRIRGIGERKAMERGLPELKI